MALYSNLHDYRFNDTEIDDIRGAAVYGSDNEKVGEIADVIFDNANGELRYVVIDSGGWLSSERFIVPARRLMIPAMPSATSENRSTNVDSALIEGDTPNLSWPKI